MEFKDMILQRESCRSYDPDRRPSKEQLMSIVDCARLAPSACNSQPWHYVIVNEPELSKQVAKCTQSMGMNKFASDCPSFVIVCEQPANLMKRAAERFARQHFAQMDIGLSVMNLCYGALSEGLSTCILGWFDEDKLKSLAGIDDASKVRLVICVGYAKEEGVRAKKRKDIEDICTYIGEE